MLIGDRGGYGLRSPSTLWQVHYSLCTQVQSSERPNHLHKIFCYAVRSSSLVVITVTEVYADNAESWTDRYKDTVDR